ncbi:hypothetical protein LZ30DRAFT_266571 [Colletotrichum cereale]|nr:hypothetical protein LZ30DRAFT_266571 [Colletotrichum cereale]
MQLIVPLFPPNSLFAYVTFLFIFLSMHSTSNIVGLSSLSTVTVARGTAVRGSVVSAPPQRPPPVVDCRRNRRLGSHLSSLTPPHRYLHEAT